MTDPTATTLVIVPGDTMDRARRRRPGRRHPGRLPAHPGRAGAEAGRGGLQPPPSGCWRRRSPHLEALRALDDAGVDLLACVTCLEHLKLTDRIAVGQVSNMREIVQRTLAAGKVITV